MWAQGSEPGGRSGDTGSKPGGRRVECGPGSEPGGRSVVQGVNQEGGVWSTESTRREKCGSESELGGRSVVQGVNQEGGVWSRGVGRSTVQGSEQGVSGGSKFTHHKYLPIHPHAGRGRKPRRTCSAFSSQMKSEDTDSCMKSELKFYHGGETLHRPKWVQKETNHTRSVDGKGSEI